VTFPLFLQKVYPPDFCYTFAVFRSVADPDPFDTDPDPAFGLDPDPVFQFDTVRIRIRPFDTDPDPYRFKEKKMYLK
jgi:hypothetical protein